MTKFIADSEKAKIDLVDLMTDMILGGATKEEIYRVVSYSQKAMEASKAYIDYNIAELERKYGGKNERKA